MKRPVFVGLTAYKGSGKSAAAKVFVEEYGFKLVKMADTLKSMVRLMLLDLGLAENEVTAALEGTPEEKEAFLPNLSNVSCRKIMETLGTEWRYMIDPNLWVQITVAKAKRHMADGYNVVCDDIRFIEEVEFVSKEIKNVQFVKIQRPSLLIATDDVHLSEIGIPHHYLNDTIINDGTVCDLNGRIRSYIERVI